jgi:hypothetical protein
LGLAYFSRNTLLPRVILTAIIETPDFRIKIAAFRLENSKPRRKECIWPRSEIYNHTASLEDQVF